MLCIDREARGGGRFGHVVTILVVISFTMSKREIQEMYSILNLIRSRMISECPLCLLKTRGAGLCEGCLGDVLASKVNHQRCSHCADRVVVSGEILCCHGCLGDPPAFFRTIYAFDYAYPFDALINGFKEQGRLAFAEMFGRMLWQVLQGRPGDIPDLECLVPVPAAAASLLRRGFNPAGEVARHLATHSGLRLSRDWLVRDGHALPQKTKTLAERSRSVQGLYRCEKRLPPIWIGLVDDVMTSGSTMRACSKALMDAGARGVVAIAVARTP